jgi:8-oxo-dGTP pyrophosphatase MutT (NUDIX family)
MINKTRKVKRKGRKTIAGPMANRDDAKRLQIAALPWRHGDAGLEILLVSSRQTRRWIIPKGWPMAGRTDSAAAGIEAMEEAGLIGAIAEEPFGYFHYVKRFSRGGELCRVDVYPMRVLRQREKWHEQHERDTHWFPVADAALMVSDPELGELIEVFAKSLES